MDNKYIDWINDKKIKKHTNYHGTFYFTYKSDGTLKYIEVSAKKEKGKTPLKSDYELMIKTEKLFNGIKVYMLGITGDTITV